LLIAEARLSQKYCDPVPGKAVQRYGIART
jgi:hypothetical protein